MKSNRDSISLNKYISDTGFCSRREADRLIESGRVKLNDELAQKGNRVNSGDQVTVDGKLVTSADKKKRVYIALNKPPGIVSTTDRNVKGNIVDFVNYPERIFHIGRLDKPSEGLILLTNDGNIVNKILRAGNAHEKEYIVSVNKPVSNAFLKKMASGVPILDTVTLPCYIEKTGTHSFRIILIQGLNRQIRRMCEVLRYEVTRLQRIRIMNIQLGNLPVGKWRKLSEKEINILMHLLKDSEKNL
ncbi:MAG: 23S rRNA pseudouridine(2604) synthase RluF [Saprospirales bacterium]|nr:MAG: 23S rRNA pseudouridine(2604) synthase RluF [Saprospirales bacterium]